jgi:parallel beta-helix repeat protein
MNGIRWIPVAFSCALGCSQSASSGGTEGGTSVDAEVDAEAGAEAAVSPCDVHLAPSADDQKAVQTALIETPAGSTICFDPGIYRFTDELTLTSRGITLRGSRSTVLDFRDQRVSARNGLLVTGSAFTIEDFAIKNTAGDGIRVEGAEGATFRRLRVSWDADARPDDAGVAPSGAYAVYPVGSSKVLIEGCDVSGAYDAGLYVGQSRTIVVRNNVVHSNVAGIEIENSIDAEVYGNDAYDNTWGILVFDLPNLPIQGGLRANVHDNQVFQNNHPYFGAGGIFAGVPVGLGVFVMAADDTEIHANTVRSNDTTGILVISCFTTAGMVECNSAVPYDQYPQRTYIHDNAFGSNGNKPDALAGTMVGPNHLEDILWDGDVDASQPNDKVFCLQEASATFRNFNSRNGFGNQSTDASPYRCMLPPLPPVDL